MRTRTLAAATLLAAGLLVAPVVASSPAAASPAHAPTQAKSVDAVASLRTLNDLPVQGRGPKTGYSRDMFGQAWSDDVNVQYGRNGCDTRNDILRRDLTDTTIKPGTRGCVVASGTLTDPYTGQTVSFVRGPGSSAVQIDHVVALSDAWQKGAMFWTAEKRRDFANDPANLLAVSGGANQSKGAGDAATWLPKNKAFRCPMVATQVRVKAKYGLSVTAAEKQAITRILSNCQDATTAAPARPAPVRPQPRQPQTRQPQAQPESTYYKNCSAARAAGAAPIYRGQPGYGAHLDRDGDGVACE